ncbi:NfeD family protein [Algoriphagus winogradskyi]|uniref:NfeD-like C-terminal, partner-binding n=1 Tax=Algoriphagus winogradskyi TaxID=237017 RepID=A0ABY1ND48_9BACT|nr:NfeD family protein [Algoriphagus winogradskyi]SMP06877.1 NfeD-like C-terminal, partner-binding [Algoriphagus winogradskyi]
MTIFILSSLLIIGLVLFMIEVFLLPGTTVIGVVGLVVSLVGIYYAYLSFDFNTAMWIVGITVIFNVVVIWYGFTSGIWSKFSLKSKLEGGAFDGRTDALQIGMPGKAISDLKPIGKATFDEKIYEVKSEDGFIEVGKIISIIKIENNKIIVK